MSLGFVEILKARGYYASQADKLFDDPDEEVFWLPELPLGKEFADVPEHIALAANEAYRCHSINAHRGAVALARAVVEATAKAKGVTQGTLYKKIDQLATDKHIREQTAEAAHEVRHLGNDVAHGDFVDAITRDEAEDALSLMGMVLDEVFTAPAMIARVRASREAARATRSAGA